LLYNVICTQVVTLFMTGYCPVASGTVASCFTAVCIFMVFLLCGITPQVLMFTLLGLVALYCIGISCTYYYVSQRDSSEYDTSEIVVDEAVGQIIALIIPFSALMVLQLVEGNRVFVDTVLSSNTYIAMLFIVSLIGFRAFDILKPGIVGRFDRTKTVTSIFMDDVMAGVYAGCCALFIILVMIIAYRYLDEGI